MTTLCVHRPCGSTGQEILDPNGTVVAWTVDAGWAGIIVGLLNGARFPKPKEPSMTKEKIKKFVAVLLRHRPDLVIVKTTSPEEKKTLVEILRDAGATVIYRDDTPSSQQ